MANWVSIEVHLGYDFPWAAHQWIPIYGGAPSHDLHHARPLSNFEPWLTHLDKLMGLCLLPQFPSSAPRSHLSGWKLTSRQLELMKKQRKDQAGVYQPSAVHGLRQFN